MIAITALVVVAVGWLLLKTSTASEARALMRDGQPAAALEKIDAKLKSQSDSSDPELLALKAAALHRLDRHREESMVLREHLAPKAPEALDPMVLEGLFDDFGRKEDPVARELLRRLPRGPVVKAGGELAKKKTSPAQWGALRYLDSENETEDLDRIELYVKALDSERCSERRVAARRLGELGDPYASEALEKLKNLPRATTPQPQCGQDEAARALTQLKRPKGE
jgi:hypothetical protein